MAAPHPGTVDAETLSKVQELEEVANEGMSDLWLRGRMLLQPVFIAAALALLNIHNLLEFILGNLAIMILFLLIRSAGRKLPYLGIGALIYRDADAMVTLFGIFLAASIGNSVSIFISSDGTIKLRGMFQIFILVIFIFNGMLILPKYFRLPSIKPA